MSAVIHELSIFVKKLFISNIQKVQEPILAKLYKMFEKNIKVLNKKTGYLNVGFIFIFFS